MTQLSEFMLNTGLRARNSAKILAVSPDSQKSKAIFKAAQWLRKDLNQILGANHQDIDAGQKRGLSDAMLDRLYLDATRVESMALGLESIAQLKDPVGEIIAQWPRPNGLKIERVRTPLGVIGVIYESRPNVTADAGALCLKAGNASILRGGSDSFHSSKTIHQCLVKGLESSELPMDAIQLVPTADRDAVG
ncbi:MAG: gamma-glutamyl-phosphate reductase, partial [Planctomycetota bacterium]